MRMVVLQSGGLDSCVLLAHLRAEGHELKSLSFNYGQKHAKEIFYAQSFVEKLKIEHRVLDLKALNSLLQSSSLTGSGDIPSGHYTDESMKSTVVPNRNMIMLSIAAAWAIDLKWDAVAFAAHHGDHTIYPDCRESFVQSLKDSLALADWHSVELLAPFVLWDKAAIAKRGAELGVLFENTWSCYRGGELHCGACGTCVERKEAFLNAGLKDPTHYETK